jgi:hypothetical protein
MVEEVSSTSRSYPKVSRESVIHKAIPSFLLAFTHHCQICVDNIVADNMRIYSMSLAPKRFLKLNLLHALTRCEFNMMPAYDCGKNSNANSRRN